MADMEIRNIHAEENPLVFALDIGTTTLALALVSLDDQRIIKTITRNNPQQIFGADVMSRILHCQKHGVTDLFEAVRSAVNQMIAEFALPEVPVLYVSGNTVPGKAGTLYGHTDRGVRRICISGTL